jgi:hypothetical protein
VCLSAGGDLVAGVGVVAIGVDACRHLRGRSEYLFVAGLPIVLGLHQIMEAFVWWGLEGHVPARIGEVAMWAYLLFAFVAPPVLVPALVLRLEPTAARKRLIVPFLALGVLVAGWLLVAMLRTPPVAEVGHLHIAYFFGLRDGVPVAGLYALATCGAMLASGFRHVVWFGLANLVAVVALTRLTADGFASLWCFYAALASGAIAAYMRIGEAEEAGETGDGIEPEPSPVPRS